MRDEINELLGVGEVSISTTAPTTAVVGGLGAEETAFTGVWRVSQNDADYFEAGRFPAAAAPQVWWVQYFNNMEKMILNSIEICDLPVAAVADEEDIAQSVNRLDEWLQSLREAG